MKPYSVILCFLLVMPALSAPAAAEDKLLEALLPDDATRSIQALMRGVSPAPKPAPYGEKAVNLHIFFPLGRHDLTADGRAALDAVASRLRDKRLLPYHFRIEGHTCDIGGFASNERLSWRRAESVRNYLTEVHKLASERFITQGFGERHPMVVNNNDEANRRRNRRVLIVNTTYTANEQNLDTGAPFTVVMEREDGGGMVTVKNADPVDSSQGYRVRFHAAESLHVYIFQQDDHGGFYPLFPRPEFTGIDNPVSAGTEVRIPRKNYLLNLDSAKGPERIIAVASPDPLEDPPRICREALDRAFTTPGEAATRNQAFRGSQQGFKLAAPASTGGPVMVPMKESAGMSGSCEKPVRYMWRREFLHR